MIVILVAVAVPAFAGTVYDNGPVNGNNDAWTINLGFIVSDSFTVSSTNTNITGLSFGAWLFPGDVLTSAEVSITSLANGGTTYFDQVVNFTQSDCQTSMFGYDICRETGTFNGGNFGAGTYWVNLQNANIPSGDPVYWDQNSGVGCTSPGCPSLATDSGAGTIASESFTILGDAAGNSVPEPSSLVLFATGFVGLAAAARRKLR